MRRSERRACSSSNRGRPAGSLGLTLVELLVTLVILSILAAAALPYAEVAVRREKELELRRALREVRGAIDGFYEDWKGGKISRLSSQASEDGYPKTLQVLVEGADTGDAKGSRRRYLRRIPRDPFAEGARAPAEHWVLRGYQDAADSLIWGGRDVYDVRSAAEGTALDGSRYKEW
jgi:general secretion pathway protein G